MKFRIRLITFISLGIPAAGGTVYASSGTDQSSRLSMGWYTWVLIAFCALCAALTAWYWTRPRRKERRRLKAAALLAGTLAVLMGAFNASGLWESQEKAESMNLIQIYGMAYDQDGGRAMIATHEGIKWLSGGQWQNGDGERHDYAAFAPYESGFYASGKPGPGSKLPNPIGLVKSTDQGKSIQVLALNGETEFHLLGVSYRKMAIYGYNEAAGAELKQPGLYLTVDEGKTWTKRAMKGFEGDPTAIAVHPDNADFMALGTRDGLFLSRDRGDTFVKLLPDTGISALSFDLDGNITVGGFKDKPSLLKLDSSGKLVQEITLPELKEDAIAHTAHNPVKPEERIISTYEHDVFMTSDGGATWYQLAVNGKTRPKPEPVPNMAPKASP